MTSPTMRWRSVSSTTLSERISMLRPLSGPGRRRLRGAGLRRVEGAVFGEPGTQAIGGHRPGEDVALDTVAAERGQPSPRVRVLDALGDHRQAQGVGEAGDRCEDR